VNSGDVARSSGIPDKVRSIILKIPYELLAVDSDYISVSNTAYSLALLKEYDTLKRYVDKVERENRGFRREGRLRDIASYCYAVAVAVADVAGDDGDDGDNGDNGVMNIDNTVRSIEMNPTRLISCVNPRNVYELSTLIWSVTKLGYKTPRLLGCINDDRRITDVIGKANMQVIVNVVSGFTKQGECCEVLLTTVDGNIGRVMRKERATSQGIGLLVYEFGKQGVRFDNTLKCFRGREFDKLFDGFNIQNLANVGYGLKRLNYDVGALVERIDVAGGRLVGFKRDAVTSENISMLSKLFSNVGYSGRSFFDVLLSNNAANVAWLKTFSTQCIVHLLYSVVILDYITLYEDIVGEMWEELMDRGTDGGAGAWSDEDLNQMAIIKLHCYSVNIHLNTTKAFDGAVVKGIRLGGIDKELGHASGMISDVLLKHGFKHTKEVSIIDDDHDGDFMAIDMGCKERKIAVENDGHTHFLRDANGNVVGEDGPTRAKERLLRRLGWKVVKISNINFRRKGWEKDVVAMFERGMKANGL
jgi:hypothetical protein